MSKKVHDENTVPVSSRLPVSLAKRIEERAADADRSVAGEVRHLIRKALETEEGYTAA